MPAPLIVVAALVCTITHPLVVKAADAIPDNELQLLYVPMTAIDIGCALFSHTPFSLALAQDIAPHAIRALAALAKYSRPLAEVRNPVRGSDPWLMKVYDGAKVQDRPPASARARPSPATRVLSPQKPARAAAFGRLHRPGAALAFQRPRQR